MKEVVEALEQIIRITDSEAYDDQAREFVKNWANIALLEIKKSA